MDKKLFCVICGNSCDKDAYCSQCGISVQENSPKSSYAAQHYTHCISCGNKVSDGDLYCAACGQECFEYAVSEESALSRDSFAGLKDSLSGAVKNKDIAGTLQKIPLKKYVSVEKIKTPAFWIPSVIFAVASIAVGLIISAILNALINAYMQNLLESMLGDLLGFGFFNFSDVNLGLGTVTLWLIACMCGLTFNFKASAYGYGVSFSGKIFIGLVILIIIPVVSLVIGNLVKNAYIKSKADDYDEDSKISSSVLGAVLFALINLILAFFPSPISSSLKKLANLSGDFLSFRASVGNIVTNVIFFSLILALFVSMPKLKNLFKTAADSGKIWLNSLSVSVQLVKKFFIAAFFITVTSLVVSGIVYAVAFRQELEMISQFAGDFGARGVLISIIALIATFPNNVFWSVATLTGGAIDFKLTFSEGRDINTVSFDNMLGTNPYRNFTYILLAIAGFLLAVHIFYRFIEKGEKYLMRGLFAAGFSAVILSAVSAMANFSLDFKGDAGTRVSAKGYMGTFGAGNVFLILLVMALAFAVVYLSGKVPALKKILDKFTGLSIKLLYLFAVASQVIITIVTSKILLDLIPMLTRMF